MSISELESEIARSRSEKASLLQRMAQDVANSWPGIEVTPGIARGDARIVRTRIPVWTLEGYRRQGVSEAEILANFPTLRAVDLVNSWAYADAHKSEIESAIIENESA